MKTGLPFIQQTGSNRQISFSYRQKIKKILSRINSFRLSDKLAHITNWKALIWLCRLVYPKGFSAIQQVSKSLASFLYLLFNLRLFALMQS
ncbi:MAG: hypothetical protein AAGF01_10645 [Cyanobacteria bacterium P01_G01_bin.38]